ncbi:MAG: D-cysteine desulfhydrase family protein [Candidatus Promineifilaceae bacterium]
MQPNFPQRIPLAHLPTPLEPLERLSRFLGGPELWVKRDDQTGLAGGGNKTRKLEFLIRDAQAQGCDHLITVGGPQSNHCRQTAAAAAKVGMSCSLVMRGTGTTNQNGNQLLDQLLGAHLYWAGERSLAKAAADVAKEQTVLGRKPYIVPLGGSNVVGSTGYVWAMRELRDQIEAQRLNFDFIIVASSSGGTQAGITLGAEMYGIRSRILGISIDVPGDQLKTQVSALATATAAHLGLGMQPVAQRVEVNDDYIEPGYGVLTDMEREAIHLVAEKEGLLVDPVYTGRAMGGLIDLIRWGAFTRRQRILFWHTGGMPALFAYQTQLGR